MIMKDQRREYVIDNLRALAILIVVFGHSIILYSSQWALYETDVKVPVLDMIKRIINIIQMPLFFSISGFLFFFTEKRKKMLEIVLDKARRLLVPFVVFALGWLLPIRLILEYSGYKDESICTIIIYKILLGYDNGHLWFLPTLFLCFIVSYIFLKKLRKFMGGGIEYIGIAMIGLLLYAIQIVIPVNGYLKFLGQYYVWFSIGMGLSSLKKDGTLWFRLAKYKTCYLIICVITIILAIRIPNIIILNISTLIFLITLYFVIPNIENNMLLSLSENSFGIYLLHSPMVYFTYKYLSHVSPLIVVGINLIIFGGISLLLTIVIRSSKIKWIVGE